MSTTQIQNPHYQSLLSGVTNELVGNDQSWLCSLRQTAAAKFSETGFPSPRDEEWRYTNVRALEKNQFKLVEKAGSVNASVIQKLLLEGCDYGVFVDGYYQADVSSIAELPAGVIVAPMSSALSEHADLLQQYLGKIINVNADGESAKRADDKGFSNFNTALFTDGMFVYLPKNTVLEKPLQLLFISSEETELGLSNCRNIVVAEAGSKGHVIETHYGAENQAYLNNVVTEIIVEANANLVHSRLQIESLSAYHIGGVYTSLQENAIFKQENYQFGAALSRVEVHADLGTASAATLNGLYIGQGRQHIDNHTRLNHHMPHAVSKQNVQRYFGR